MSEPTPEEIAAVVSLLTAMASTPGPTQVADSSAWSDREHGFRQQITPGVGAWRNSGLPR